MDMKVKQYIEMIETETLTAEKIITDLLEFGRFDSVVKEIVSASDMIGVCSLSPTCSAQHYCDKRSACRPAPSEC